MRLGSLSRRLLASVCFSFSVLSSVVARAEIVQNYKYPYRNPIVATASFVLLKGQTAKSDVLEMKLRSGREGLPLVGDRSKFKVALYRQSGRAPLIVLIPGMGGHFAMGSSGYLADLLYHQGYHVISMVSPLHWGFAVSTSSSGVPGITQADAKDLYEGMQLALAQAKRQYGLKVSSLGLMGWSLGALESAHIAAMDDVEKKMGFRTVLLANPPVDLLHGIKALDALEAAGRSWTATRRANIDGRAVGLVAAYLEKDIRSPSYFADLETKLHMTETELRYAMGSQFRSSLGEVILVGQQINDFGILKTRNKASWDRLAEAKTFDYYGFIENFVMRVWEKNLGRASTVEELNARSGLAVVDSFLRNSDKVFVMHNADDFLLTPEDTQYLKDTFGERLQLYPYGGHLGNLWYPANRAHMLKVFSRL